MTGGGSFGAATGEDRLEYELKARLEEDTEAFRARLTARGWRRTFRGEMVDRRYDTPERRLEALDEVLRLRCWRAREERAVLGWKGPARSGEFRVREELETHVADRGTAEALLARLGFTEVTLAIDRRVDIFQKDGVVVRIEEYPRMDVLVEIEGPPPAVEERIPELGLRREAWRPWGLSQFVSAFERRTGERARLATEEP